MSDIGDAFAGHREASQIKRAANRENGARLLREAGIDYTSHNNHAHLIIGDRWDYWPGTGLWIDRDTGNRQRGVMHLLAAIKKEATQVPDEPDDVPEGQDAIDWAQAGLPRKGAAR